MSDETRPGYGSNPPDPYALVSSTSTGRLLRLPQFIALVAALASVVILVLAVVAPGVFTGSGSKQPEVDIAQLQLTAEAEALALRPTSEVALSDLLPTAPSTSFGTVIATEADADDSTAVASMTAAPEAAVEPTATPMPSPTPTVAPLMEGGGVQLGVALEEFPGDFGAVPAFGELSGRMPDLVMFFQAWGNSDRDFKDWLPVLDSMGVTPIITWEPWDRTEFIDQRVYTQESILAGEHDPYIDNWARRAAEYGNPIYLRFAHEMNTPPGKTYWYPWQGNPEQYVAVWRYVHDRFVAAGAINVSWVWSVAWMNDDARLYYPGDEYVDAVGITILNFGAGKPDSRWRSFAELYSIQQSRVLAFRKPVLITELATAEQGGDKGAWIAAIGDDIRSRFPEIQGLVWLNYTVSREYEAINWRVDSSPAALEGWRRLVSHPVFASD